MDFGRISSSEAEGAILGHSVSLGDGVLKKGTLLAPTDIERLAANNINSVYAARLGDDDVAENEAAFAIGEAIAGEGVRVEKSATGRCNLFALEAGVVEIDARQIVQLNQLDESLTLACLRPFERVEKGQMLATVKIIPYAVPRNTMDAALKMVGEVAPVQMRAFSKKRVGLIISQLPHSKPALLEKTEQVMRERIEGMGCELGRVSLVDHDANAVSLGLNSLIPHHDVALVFGASAIVDRADVVPVAISQVGGKIEHLGMPVDPGNLLLLAAIGDMPVIGVPTCARSLKRNGFDWVLERLLAGIEVTGADLAGMGVGGLLKEIASRPHPREA